MGAVKEMILNHQENCAEQLSKEFVSANIADFLGWAYNQDITDIWDLIVSYCEDVNADAYFEFCMNDLN